MIQPAFNQTQVQPGIDLGFADGLRALMRQDPDIIMVGEIRDLETAEMAIQAALTGHLVFAPCTPTTRPSAITRLLDLGVAPLPDRLDADRRAGAAPGAHAVPGLQGSPTSRRRASRCDEVDQAVAHERRRRPYKPVGCLECRMTGYRGRAGLYELLTVSDAARATSSRCPTPRKLRQQALHDGLRPLRLAGAMKVAEGVTTLEEVLRATPAWE